MSSFILNEKELEAFPDPKEYYRRLQHLDKFNFKGKSYEEIENIFYENAIILPSLIVRQPKDFYKDLNLYRARLNIDNYDLGLINTHTYPNSYFCKENGRCNLKGRTVMYCSDNPNAALYEVNPVAGDTGYLSIWNIKKEIEIKITSLLPPDLPDGNRWLTFAKESHKKNRRRWELKYPHLFNSYTLLRAFLAEKFYEESEPYYLSSFISNKMLYEGYNDFLLYKSVKVNGFYCNIAVHPNFADEYLSLKKIVQFNIKGFKDGIYNFSTGRIGEFKEGRLDWRKKNSSDDEDVFNLFRSKI